MEEDLLVKKPIEEDILLYKIQVTITNRGLTVKFKKLKKLDCKMVPLAFKAMSN